MPSSSPSPQQPFSFLLVLCAAAAAGLIGKLLVRLTEGNESRKTMSPRKKRGPTDPNLSSFANNAEGVNPL